jgi:hypothetical protein
MPMGFRYYLGDFMNGILTHGGRGNFNSRMIANLDKKVIQEEYARSWAVHRITCRSSLVGPS